MSLLRSLLLLTLVALVAAGCVRKAPSTPIDGLELVKDEVRKFEVKVPKNWIKQTQRGDLILAISKPGLNRRFVYFDKGEGGAKVEMRAIPLDSTRTVDTLIKNSRLQFDDPKNDFLYKVENVTLGGKPAKKLSVKFDQEDGEFRSEAYFAENDSVCTILTLASFGGGYEEYAEAFKEVVSSLKLARRPDAPKTPDTLAPTGPQPPSDTLRSYSASDFTIQIPQNFEGKKLSEGGTLSSVNLFGSRLDCNIRVDVFDASKQKNLEKILAQNKKNYGDKDPVGTKLSGQKAAYFSYNPTATVSSRAYFCVKDDKMFRITVNWFKPEQNVYLPIFEKCVNSVSFK
jgi:hypothetical protein